ncbi:MAG: hypothetical protein IPG55_15985 [Saprospiraceae bacterium]|nr:hypothetical protein [Candidatus Defluviibacterium haderslevense]MBK7242512.1 hypothetical protein [Candidatus Defluviibacterium haderslevense]
MSISSNHEKFVPMSIEELNERIVKSEQDFTDEKYIAAEELITKYSK